MLDNLFKEANELLKEIIERDKIIHDLIVKILEFYI